MDDFVNARPPSPEEQNFTNDLHAVLLKHSDLPAYSRYVILLSLGGYQAGRLIEEGMDAHQVRLSGAACLAQGVDLFKGEVAAGRRNRRPN